MTSPSYPFGRIGFTGQILPLIIVRDIISDNWNGTIPPNLPDLLATAGYALSAAQGAAQFNGPVFINGELRIGANADVFIGGPGSTDAQLFVDNILQHFNMRATNDPDYPDQIGILDVIWSATEGRAIRIFWADAAGPTFTRLIEIFHEASPPLINFWPTQTPSGTPALSITPEGLGREFAPAYLFKETVTYTSNDTFTKGDYPGLRAVRIRCQGGGGGGGSAGTTGAGQVSLGVGGAGGGYAESWELAANLDTNEAVTVGAAGAGGTSGAGGDGGDSVFDTISNEVRGFGGQGGPRMAASTAGLGLATGGVGTGQIITPGESVRGRFSTSVGTISYMYGFEGGRSFLGQNHGVLGNSNVGAAGGNANSNARGAGGSGGFNSQNQGTSRDGGDGAAGIVYVDVYT